MKKSRNLVVVSILIAILIILVISNEIIIPKGKVNPPLIIIRIDDVQDFAFRDAQLFLVNYSIENEVPFSLAVIPDFFGEDLELVEIIKQAMKSSEIVVHGWEHENLTQFSFDEQKIRLQEAKKHLEQIFEIEPKVLVPPMFSYNKDTIQAMKETDYSIVSGLSEFHNKGWVSSEVFSLPATVELSDYGNETWHMINNSVILNEVENSIEVYGYAMIVTHPQEFMKNGKFNPEIAAKFEQILQNLNEKYSFTTIEDFISYL